jgi:Conserved protein/domain typically associated with flavoprotein oxygenases, DIM6/NTAB family
MSTGVIPHDGDRDHENEIQEDSARADHRERLQAHRERLDAYYRRQHRELQYDDRELGRLRRTWNKNICFCVIRPHRYTYGFVERMDHFTLSFFTPEDREKLSICGSCSGKDVNKAHAAGLTPLALGTSAVYFAEARLVLECRKIYFHDITPHNFLDVDIDMHYPEKDYHRLYIGEIMSCRTR